MTNFTITFPTMSKLTDFPTIHCTITSLGFNWRVWKLDQRKNNDGSVVHIYDQNYGHINVNVLMDGSSNWGTCTCEKEKSLAKF
jgi:hypothetical protein